MTDIPSGSELNKALKAYMQKGAHAGSSRGEPSGHVSALKDTHIQDVPERTKKRLLQRLQQRAASQQDQPIRAEGRVVEHSNDRRDYIIRTQYGDLKLRADSEAARPPVNAQINVRIPAEAAQTQTQALTLALVVILFCPIY